MKKKFTSIILSLFMMFSVFVGNISNVSAATKAVGVYVNGQKLTENIEYKDSNGVVQYKYSGKVLYLYNTTITNGVNFWSGKNSLGQDIDDEAGIFINTGNTSDIFTIKFKGTNKIALTKQNVSMASYGIYSDNDLIIEGSENASLEVIANNAGQSSIGIHGTKTIKILQGHIKATALPTSSTNQLSYGIRTTGGDITIGDSVTKKEPIIDVNGKTGHIEAKGTGTSVKINLSCNKTLNTSTKKAHLGHKLTKHDAVDAKCLEDGNELNYECETCRKRYKDSTGITEFSGTSYIKAKHVESLTYVGENDATCTSDGNITYYHCGVCEKNYRDANGTNVITDIVGDKVCSGHDASFVPKTPATCTSDGLQEHYQCNRCNKYFTDEECVNETTLANLKISATGHDNPMVHKAYKAATCTEDGNVEYYYCSKCNKYFEDEEATEEIDEDDITLTKTGHSMQHVAKVPAKCEEDGCEEYYYCSRCDKYFRDEEGQNVVTLSGLKIDATGHDFDDGVVSVKDNVKTTTYTCKNCQTTKVVTEDIKEVISGNDKNDETKVDKKEETKVNTGDNSNLVLWFSLLALSIISLFVVRKSTVRR